MDDDAKKHKKKRAAAKKKGDKTEEKAATIEYLTTQEGIESLEDAGKLELAEKFVERRNQKIRAYNRKFNGGSESMPLFLPYAQRDQRPLPGYRLPPIWNAQGFNVRQNQPRVHRDTRQLHNKRGFDAAGVHANGTRYNAEGFNTQGYDVEGFNAQGWDREGYGRDGYNADHFTRPRNVLDFTRLTRPNAAGKRFQLDGFPEFETDPDIYGWLHGEQVGDARHVSTGTNLNPNGQSYLEELTERRKRGNRSWLADPRIKKWWPQG
ncbi:hypothetical protein [Citricoccus nitrophenolicus]|uniref:hypothetical protein n=1 Tax=Citricoccus nitrophenolicus TaxID=863575 RepID=UPI0031E621FB